MARKIASYGSWKSPITTELIVAGSIGLGQIAISDGAIYWSELRPAENGRVAVVKWTPDRGVEDLLPADFNARTRVHEYGGGSFLAHEEVLYFANFADQRLYRQYPNGEPEALTPIGQDYRYADGIVDPVRGRLILVREDHTRPGQEAENTIVALDLDDATAGRVLIRGNDFYAAPRLSPDGNRLAWLTWNHPNMPWNGTELWVGDVTAGDSIENRQLVAGGPSESIFQPAWSPQGYLHFISDRTGWWNVYRRVDGRVEALAPLEAEFGRPQWVLGMATYGFESAESLICSYTRQGLWQLARLDATTGKLAEISTPFTVVGGRGNLVVSDGQAAFVGGSPKQAEAIVRLDLATDTCTVLRSSSDIQVDAAYFSQPQAIEFPTANGRTAHAFYYPPQNRDFTAPEGEEPPLIVISHGGPTSTTSASLSLSTQFWTSRGFALLDVNYGGSTGYGRPYRERLNGQWGIVDVEDCVNGARYLVAEGRVDAARLAVRGGSAGGYTTLCALAFHDIFGAGASYFGVSDVEALARDTHKFESRYLDSLIGPYPENKDLYRERSPIHFADQISCPLILLQGLEDRVVPPDQAEKMFDALRAKGLPVAYLAFAGEQHGFRRAENIRRALDAELYFYGRVFHFEPADLIDPVPIENLA